MRPLSIFILSFLFVSITFSFYYWNKVEGVSFNWFKVPTSREIYLLSYNENTNHSIEFEIFSSADMSCSLKTCNGETQIFLDKGSNKVNYSTVNCVPYQELLTNITCNTLSLHFYTDQTGEGGTFNVAKSESTSNTDIKNFPYDLFLILVLVLIFLAVLRKKYKLDFSWMLLAFYSLFVIFIVLQFQLVNNFKITELVIPVAIILFILLLKHSKEKKNNFVLFPQNIKKEALIFALIYAFYVLALKTIIGANDIWWPYYSRNTENTFLKGTTFFEDNLSYLGRDFTFPPVFFEFATQVSKLLNAKSFYDIQFYLHMLLVAVFAFTSYLLFIKFETRNQRIIATLIYTSLVFTFLTSVAGTLHTFSFTLLNISVIFFNSNNPLKKLSPILLGFSYATHPLTLFMFLVYVYATNQFKINIKNISFNMIIAVFVSLVFYVPIFLRSGFPNEIVPRQWGYMITYGTAGMYFDFQFLIPLMVLTFVYGVLNKKFRLQSLLILLLVLSYLNISYRLNMFLSILLAGTFTALFKDELRNKIVFNLVFLALLMSFAFSAVIYSGTKDWCTWGAVNDMCLAPMDYIKTYTSPSDSVAINPIYGHLETYYGQRKVLADLYVEYADYNKFKAEEDFYKNSDVSVLEPYNISVFVLDDIGEKRDLPNEDRIYDNGFFHIFRKA